MRVPDDPEAPDKLFPLDHPEWHEGDFENIQKAEHVVDALSAFDNEAMQLSLLRRFADAKWRKRQQEKYGTGYVYQWQQETTVKHAMALDTARVAFSQANPEQELVDSGATQQEAAKEVARRFETFKAYYQGTSKNQIKKRTDTRRQYEQVIHWRRLTQDVAEERQIVETIEFPVADPKARISLARALRPEFNYLRADDFADIDNGTIHWLTPKFFSASLIDVAHNTRNARWRDAEPGTGKREVLTVFTPGEWKVLLRSSPKYLADVAFNGSEVTQHSLNPLQRDLAAPEDARIAAALTKAEEMEAYRDEQLSVQLALIDRFKEAAQFNGGLARFGNESNMREQLNYFWEVIIGDMVWATRIARRSGAAEEDYMFRALQKFVYFAPTHQTKLSRFVTLGDVASQWITARSDHMHAQILHARQYAEQQRTQREVNAAKQVSSLLF